MMNNKNSVEALVEQAAAYAAAVNALRLVDSRDGNNKTGGQYILCDFRELPQALSKRKRTGEPVVEVAPTSIEHKARVVVELNHLQQWCSHSSLFSFGAQVCVC